MQTIQVTQDFVLSLEDGTKRAFKAGMHEVEDHIANHWYTKAHSNPVESPAAASQPVPPNNPTPAAKAAANSSGDAASASATPAAETPPTNKKK